MEDGDAHNFGGPGVRGFARQSDRVTPRSDFPIDQAESEKFEFQHVGDAGHGSGR